MTDLPTRKAMAYDKTDRDQLDWHGKQAELAKAEADPDYNPHPELGWPTDAQKTRFTRGHAHGGDWNRKQAAEMTRQARQ